MTLNEKSLPPPGRHRESSAAVAAPHPRPEGWVDHPKIPVTRSMVLGGIAIVLVGLVVAIAAPYVRRTQTELTTKFWGADAIRSMQLGPYVKLHFDSDGDKDPVDLTSTPGLGHLRHALLDQRHYLWETEQAESIESLQTPDAKYATLIFSDPRTDPNVKIPTLEVRLELQGGWVGTHDGSRRVQLTERAQPAVRHFLTLLRNAQQLRYGDRSDKL